MKANTAAPARTDNTVAPERLTVMRPLVFHRTAGAAPDPKLAQQKAQQEARNQTLAAAFASADNDQSWGNDGLDATAIGKALKSGANVNTVVSDLGQTALHVATTEQDAELVAELLRRGANTRARDIDGLTPLIRALRDKNWIAGILARAEEKPEAQVSAGRHAIHDAAAKNLIEPLQALIARGVSPTLKDVDGDSPLVEALKHGALHAVLTLALAGGVEKHRLAEYQAVMDSNDSDNLWPGNNLMDFLTAAAKVKPPALPQHEAVTPQKLGKREETFFKLLREGDDAATGPAFMKKLPDTAARDGCWDTPLHCALTEEMTAAALMLLKASDVNAAGSQGLTPLHVAAERISGISGSVVEALLAARAKVNARDVNGQTPLMLAALAGAEENTGLLLRAGADAGLKDVLGFTAADYARFAGQEEVRDLLRDAQKEKTRKAVKKPATAFAKTAAKKPAAKKPAAKKIPVKKSCWTR